MCLEQPQIKVVAFFYSRDTCAIWSDNESNNEESSSDIESQEEEEEGASENGVEAEGT